MNRNTESRFALNPSVTIGRSTFKRPSQIKTSFNVGQLVPFYIDDVLPGDTFKIKTSKVARLQPLVTAPMDNLYLDTYYFFVPLRLLWSHFKEFMGENNECAWMPTTEYTTPQVEAPTNGWNVGTIADYMGLPVGVDNISVSALPFRAYALIVDQWFRSTVVDDPVNCPIDDVSIAGSNGDNYITDLVKGGKPFIANKFFDYFTGALPSPQRGPDTLIPIGTKESSYEITGNGNVIGNGFSLGLTDTFGYFGISGSSAHDERGISFKTILNQDNFGKEVGSVGYGASSAGNIYDNVIGVPTKAQLGEHPEYSGLIADLSGVTISGGTELSIGSINQLRLAFQIQKYYEKLARGGDRYIEQILSMFGVHSPDARLQRTEYLGGNRMHINISQVIQNSESGSTPQGNVAGQSLTVDVHNDFNHSFTEHGFVIGLMVARYDHTYQQGIERLWTRKDKFDYYWPVFANIGEQAIKNKELFAQGDDVLDEDTGKAYDEEVFGYQEAWADYRYKPSKVTGEMRSAYATSLDSWHFADDYEDMPYLSSDWLKEDKTNVDRTLAVKSTVSNQLFADIYIENITTRPMPMYSIPGLIDHH